ncbi:MAG: hypothetical protein AB7G75_33730 [Candidatus Binatia bacterium]
MAKPSLTYPSRSARNESGVSAAAVHIFVLYTQQGKIVYLWSALAERSGDGAVTYGEAIPDVPLALRAERKRRQCRRSP